MFKLTTHKKRGRSLDVYQYLTACSLEKMVERLGVIWLQFSAIHSPSNMITPNVSTVGCCLLQWLGKKPPKKTAVNCRNVWFNNISWVVNCTQLKPACNLAVQTGRSTYIRTQVSRELPPFSYLIQLSSSHFTHTHTCAYTGCGS